MKIQRVVCKDVQVIATGVEGGGYVSISCPNNSTYNIGTNADELASFLPNSEHKFYLNEGEQLYGRGTTTSFAYTVIYLNNEPTPENNTQPLTFNGSFTLSQN